MSRVKSLALKHLFRRSEEHKTATEPPGSLELAPNDKGANRHAWSRNGAETSATSAEGTSNATTTAEGGAKRTPWETASSGNSRTDGDGAGASGGIEETAPLAERMNTNFTPEGDARIEASNGVEAVRGVGPSQSVKAARSLWDRAYDDLKSDPNSTKPVAAYEELLRKEYLDGIWCPLVLFFCEQGVAERERQLGNAAFSTAVASLTEEDGTGTSADASGPLRQEQLMTMIDLGLKRMDEKKTKYTIAGREFSLRDPVIKSLKVALWAKDLISLAVKDSPEASTAWAVATLILPLLTNAATADEAVLDGFTYVTSRASYYAALEKEFLGPDAKWGSFEHFAEESVTHVVDLYKSILDFQIRTVLRLHRNPLANFGRDMIQHDDWETWLDKVKQHEELVDKDLAHLRDKRQWKTLEDLRANAEKLLSAIQKQYSSTNEDLEIKRERLRLEQEALRYQRTEKEEKCHQLFRLTTDDRDTSYEFYKNRVKDLAEGTGRWFLTHPSFETWLRGDTQPLLVTADPGCGKSVLAKHLVDKRLPQESASSICYFFFKDQDQNTVRQALCALLHQIFNQQPALIRHALPKYSANGPRLPGLTSVLWDILREVGKDPDALPITIVLDALDECDEDEFRALIQDLKRQFRSGGRIKFLMTSRPYSHVVSEFQELVDASPHIHIPGEESSDLIREDVNRVIEYRVERLGLPLRVKDYLRNQLLKMEHRTYLWVYLVFDFLKTRGLKKTPEHIQSAIIDSVPTNVNEAYEKILDRATNREEARKALSIVLAAGRPLTLTEMQVALELDLSSDPADIDSLEDDADFKTRLVDMCGLFISVYNGRVYFLHQTAREFLLCDAQKTPSGNGWQQSITYRQAHRVMAEACVAYLHLPANAHFSEKEPEHPYRENLTVSITGGTTDRAFLFYSAKYWPQHFRDAEVSDDDITLIQTAASICWPESPSIPEWAWIFNPEISPPQTTLGILIPTICGLHQVVKYLLDTGTEAGVIDRTNATPLAWAASNGDEAMVRLLLQAGLGLWVDTEDIKGWTPLSRAAAIGNEAVVRLLLEAGAAVDVPSKGDWTALSWAADRGHTDVARILVEAGAKIDVRAVDGLAPLSLAAGNGHEGVVELLLGMGAEVDAEDDGHRTPLLWAAADRYRFMFQEAVMGSGSRGHDGVVQKLLEAGANVDAEDAAGRTPLSWAARHGCVGVVKLLLAAGAKVDKEDTTGRTPLSLAAEHGHQTVVGLLLAAGANIRAEDTAGRTPLSWAAQSGQEAVAEQLITAKVSVDAEDKQGRTPLSWAATTVKTLAGTTQPSVEGGVVRLLLHCGAKVNAEDQECRTPLWWAASSGDEAKAAMLLAAGAMVDAEDRKGGTPLASAAENGHKTVVNLLLKSGAKIDPRNKKGRTPLSLAAGSGKATVVGLLLEAGAAVDAPDRGGRTPLSWAATHGHESVVQLLLEAGARLDQPNQNGRTPLWWAAACGHEAVVRMLLKGGAHIDAEDKDGRTPLSRAASEGIESVVEVLVRAGAKADAQDKQGLTPLWWAASEGNVAVVRALIEAGANAKIDAEDRMDQTALSVASERGHTSVVQLLLSAEAKADVENEEHRPPLLLGSE